MQTVIINYYMWGLIKFTYLPPYEREVRTYILASSDYLKRTIKNFDCGKALFIVDVNKKALFFNETINA